MSERIKTLVAKRAIFSSEFGSTLQDLLTAIFQKEPTALKRVAKVDLLKSLVFAKIEDCGEEVGVLVHVFEFENGTTGSINFASTRTTAGIEEVDPPAEQEFLISDMALLVKGNSIIASGMANKNRTFARCLSEVCERLGLIDSGVALNVADVPNKVTLEELRDVGVSKIEFGVTGYLNSLPEFKSKTAKVIKTILTQPKREDQLRKRANTVGRMTLSRGRFKKDEIHKDEWLTLVGAQLVESDAEESYSIFLENGKQLTNSNLKLQKKVKVRRYANTVHFGQLDRELKSFQRELVADGFIL